MKKVKFNIDLVKKIQAGEIKGCIKTRNGRTARFLGEIKDLIYPLAFAIEESLFDVEILRNYTAAGKYYRRDEHENDIILEIEEEQPKRECQFKPFDRVLVRDSFNQRWHPNFYAEFDGLLFYTTDCRNWTFCVPYEGNEHLLGTADKIK